MSHKRTNDGVGNSPSTPLSCGRNNAAPVAGSLKRDVDGLP
jgi:hypothetical protein